MFEYNQKAFGLFEVGFRAGLGQKNANHIIYANPG